jgi:hypothetical protein
MIPGPSERVKFSAVALATSDGLKRSSESVSNASVCDVGRLGEGATHCMVASLATGAASRF